MTTLTQDRFAEAKTHFSQLFNEEIADHNGQVRINSQMMQLRRNAMEALESLSFPTRRDEDFKYTNFNRALKLPFKKVKSFELDTAKINAYRLDDIAPIQLVFVNGVWDAALSRMDDLPKGLFITSIEDALNMAEYKSWIVEQYAKETEGNAAFTALNLGLGEHGVFIHVAKNTTIEQPIQLLHLAATGDEPMIFSPQLFVQADASSQLHIIENYNSLNTSSDVYLSNGIARFKVADNAFVRHFRIQNESREAFKLTNTDVEQGRDSNYQGFTIDLGGRIVRNNISSEQQGSGANTNMYGVYLGNGDQHIDNQSFMDHASAHCTSNELYKGILTDKARGVFNGKVMVRKDSQKINAFQQNSSLVLTQTAVMDTKPQLEIYADDVRCSHGATIGQLDEKSVFYLRSRGLTDSAARAMLQHAFVLEVLENINNEALYNHVESLIEQKFAENQ